MTRSGNPSFGLLPGAVFGAAIAALGGSLWAALGGVGCRACQDVSALVGGWPLAWIGVAVYALLSLLAGWGKRQALTQIIAFAAVGFHLVLLFVLWRHHLFCLACIFTALAALTCAGLTCAIRRPRVLALSTLVIAALLALWSFTNTSPPPQPQLPPVPPGHVRLLVYERSDCYECAMFEAQIVPRLQDDFGDVLTIVRTPAAPGMQTPTIVVEGKSKLTFTGVPAVDVLERAAKDALGESR